MSHKIFRCFAVLFFALVLSLSGFTPARAAPPTNDNFANAEVISSLPFSTTVDTTEATAEPNENTYCAFPTNTVWYSFTPTENIAVRIDMAGSQVQGAVSIFLATGPSISDLTFLTCAGFFTSTNVQMVAGQTYYLEGTTFSPTGVIQINMQQITPPANDNFANAEVIPSLPFNTSVDNTNATIEPNEPQNCSTPYRTMWYSFTPAQDMAVEVDMVGSPTAGNVSVFSSTGSTISDLAVFGCVYGSSTATNLQFNSGRTYYIRVDSSVPPGTLQVNITQISTLANDNFANAQDITSLPFAGSVDNTNASLEADEPSSCFVGRFRSVWYSFTPAENMAIQVDAFGSPTNDVVGVFLASGPAITDLSRLGCIFSNSSANLQLDAGKTYYFLVDSFGTPGVLQFNVQQLSAPSNDRFDSAETIPSLPFTSSVDNTNASAEAGEPSGCSSPFRSLWYSFTPAEDMLLQAVSPNGATVSIFQASGPSISDLSLVNCGFAGNLTNFYVTAGQTYYIQVDSSGQTGVLQLSLQQIFPTTNDFFADAEVISSLPFSATIDNSSATSEPNEPQGCGSPTWSLWYSFTPAATTAVRLSISGGPVGSAVDVYLASGPGITDLSSMGCAAYGTAANFRFEAGKTYYLRAETIGLPGVLQLDMQQITPPANDDFANAESISALPFIGTADNTNATSEIGEPLGCSGSARSVWYSFTPAQDISARFNTADFSGVVSVFQASGPAFSDLQFMTCASATPANVQLLAGKTYYLRLDSFGLPGVLQFSLRELNPPANDNFANAEVITTTPFNTTVDITDAGYELNEPQYCAFMPNTVWYSFTPTETMTLRANTVGSSISGNVNVYQSSGPGFSGLQFISCSANNPPPFQVQAGQTYYLQVGSSSSQTGILNVNLVQPVPPANDNLANATEISSLPFSATGNLLDATNEPDEPQVCFGMPNTVWYSFTPTETIKVRADTTGSAVTGNVSVYHALGSGFSNLQFINCSGFGSGVAFLAQAGETYYFQLGAIGQPGIVQLNLAAVPILTGRITDLTGTPLAGDSEPFATATLYHVCGDGCTEYVNSQQVDSSGKFFFDSFFYGAPMPAGSYLITVTAHSYISRQFGPFQFNNENLDVGDLALTPGVVIHGRAVDALTGNPLVGASVTLQSCDNNGCSQFAGSQITDSNGQFLFNSFYYGDPLPAGTYDLEFSATFYDTKHVQVTVTDGENRDLGDVLINPTPRIGSISGRLLDELSGQPIAPALHPAVTLFRCDEAYCSDVETISPASDGTFRFETDINGNRLTVGSYRIGAQAEQYFDLATIAVSDVTENENRNVGEIKLTSFPIRFTDVQPCADIPASGGDCNFSVKLTNGTARSVSGKTWTMANAALPQSFAGFTDFQVKDPQDLDLASGRSQVFRFRFSVPANPGPYGTYICTQIYAGRAPQPFLNTIGFSGLFCVVRNVNGFAMVSPQAVAPSPQTRAASPVTGTEVEPNNSCQTAQDLGAFSDPFVMSGELDSSQTPDVDFFRFTGTPGAPVTIDLEGQSTGKGTLFDPFLGLFDSNCNLITANDDSGSLNSHIETVIPADGIFVLAATACCDGGFGGGGNGTYQLTVAPVQFIGSINGTLTDAVTGRPLRGDAAPFAFIQLIRCETFGCFEQSVQSVGRDGKFHLTTGENGALRVGTYMIIGYADQYHPAQTATFTVGEGENYNIGNVALQSFPIRFTDIQMCSVPSDGSLCDFSVKITNGLSTRFTGSAWSLINAVGIGSFTDFSHFQANPLRDVNLDPGRSTTLRFQFQVRGSVRDGASICASAYVGANPSPFFDTAGQRFLFCFQKGINGLSLMSEQQMHQQIQQMERWEAAPPTVPSIKK